MLIINILMLVLLFSLGVLHPVSVCLSLVVLTLYFSFAGVLILNFQWSVMILFLIFVGGMMVMFLYMSSMTPNEPFKLNMFIPLAVFLLMIVFGGGSQWELSDINPPLFFISIPWEMVYLAFILFMVLTIITKVSLVIYGPVRSMNYAEGV